jgi:hypothetical protein
MFDLYRATIVAADPPRFRATVRLERDGRLFDRIPVNGGIAPETLTPGQPCLLALLDDEALVVSTRVD